MLSWLTIVLAISCASTSHKKRQIAQSPMVDWEVAEDRTFQTSRLKTFEDYTFRDEAPDQKGIRSDSVVIIERGKIVYEKYARGYSKDKAHLTWSISKSVLSALVGIAVQEGKIRLDDSVCHYLTELAGAGAPCDSFKVRHLLEMSSGLGWNEVYEDSLKASSVIAMLYTEGYQDMARFALGHKFDKPPGTQWKYSSADTNILSAVLNRALDGKLNNFAWEKLFGPLGFDPETTYWERDQSGAYVGSSYFYSTPRDLARLGQLYLDRGKFQSEVIIDPDWIDYSTSVLEVYSTNPVLTDAKDVPGPHWWLNKKTGLLKMSPWPAAPDDMILASGHWGQYLFIIPSLDLVIVRFADDRDGSFDSNRFLTQVFHMLGIKPASLVKGSVAAPKLAKGFDSALNYAQNTMLGVAPAYVAKEVCSCVFLEKQSDQFCVDKFAQTKELVMPIDIDHQLKAVTVGLRKIAATGAVAFLANRAANKTYRYAQFTPQIGCALK